MGIAAAMIGTAVIGGVTSVVSGNRAAGAARDAANTAAASADRASEVNRYIYDTTRADYAPYRQVGNSALNKLADMYGVSRPTGAPTSTATGSQANNYGVMSQFGLDPNSIEPYSGQTYGSLVGSYGGGVTGSAAASVPMTSGFDGFQASPGYQFRLSEGMKAIERSAAARGALRGGATMKAIGRYADNTASGEFENYANRLASLAGVGQNANAGSAQAGQAYSAGNMQAANISGNAAIQAGNARASAYQNTGNAINGTLQNVASSYLYSKGYGGGGGFGG